LAVITRNDFSEVAHHSAAETSEQLWGHARRAQAEGRWDDLIATVALLRSIDPADSSAALLAAEGYREVGDLDRADAALDSLDGRDATSVESLVSRALNAERRSDFEAAAARWSAVREQFPDFAYAWAAGATTLSILEREDDAETLLTEALGRDLATIEILAARVHVALVRGDWLEAWRRWRSVGAKFPDHAYSSSVASSVNDAVKRGLSALETPELKRHALLAETQSDWDAALLYWRAGRDREPGRADFTTGIGRVLRRAARFDEADRVFSDAYDRHAGDVEFRANYAEVAASRKDWPEALRRWEIALTDFPDVPAVWSMAATAYREVGQLDKARSLLAKASKQDPGNAELVVQQALTAEKGSDWKEAIRFWDRASSLLPDDLVIRDARGNAIWERQIADLEAGESAQSETTASPTDVGGPKEEGASLRSLALSFEGLGDQCEFGIVQRRLGADPIGLFRFAAISAENMIALLDDRFAKLGDPEHTELGLTEGGEYLVRDRRNLYHMHSFVQKDTVDPDVFLSQQVKRLGYLKRKLMDDLTSAEKIFVFKSSLSRISDETLCDLRAAIGRYGDGILIGLRRAEPDHPAGSVSVVAPRTLVGYLNTEYSGEQKPIDFASWRRVLIRAVRYRTQLMGQIGAQRESVSG
jgi:tetratricopeptide (TPR) repeat protein